jgi:UDP-N-acetylglucosamine 2-epimerase (non-hydrolysing)
LLIHALGDLDDAPRLAPVLLRLAERGVLDQVVADATASGEAEPVLADLGVDVPVRRVQPAAGSLGVRLGSLLDGFSALIAGSTSLATVVHAQDDAGLACALASARQRVPVVSIGATVRAQRPAHEHVNGMVFARLADMYFVPGSADARRLAKSRTRHDQIQIVGNPLIDAVRAASGKALARRAWASAGFDEGGYVFVVLTGAAAPPSLVAPLVALAARVPTLVELSPAVESEWRAKGALAALARSSAKIVMPAGFVDRVSCERGAGAIATDSERVHEEAAALGIRCHTLLRLDAEAATVAHGATVALGDDAWALEAVRPQGGAPTPLAIPLWDGRASTRIAEHVVTNFARIPQAPVRL